MKSISSRTITSMLESSGYYLVNTVGSHRQYKHPLKSGRVTVPHPVKDLPKKTVKSIEKQAGIRF
ncbi:type II toxin-antitoxin system HicA family toxin [Cytobacillus firmus]|uniref:type II toxin-antitoxin system HicA family toxin n=1 Tax=Cytobacillus firmus TaxID=1399 RepID=UPI00064EA219|nr:type II toxin-antitoxin system HicA family toxin [Cytobacillus firmus]